ncbi:MAG: hypothetical protein Q7K42_01190 [Candidatus Diapherotrites archaeon]|nr:hypothetical protein [Candidatus Diapherotrites archaeon]
MAKYEDKYFDLEKMGPGNIRSPRVNELKRLVLELDLPLGGNNFIITLKDGKPIAGINFDKGKSPWHVYFIVSKDRERIHYPALAMKIYEMAEKEGGKLIAGNLALSGIRAMQRLKKEIDFPVRFFTGENKTVSIEIRVSTPSRILHQRTRKYRKIITGKKQARAKKRSLPKLLK